jgi:FkbM family methyltransferase
MGRKPIPTDSESDKLPRIANSGMRAPGSQVASKLCDELLQELNEWAAAGITVRLWWRDDDAVSDTPALRRLFALAQEIGAVVGLAVIPAAADLSLAKLVEVAPCCVWQHGFSHNGKEFGDGRLLSAMTEDALGGQSALDRLLGPRGWQRVFVPPFHMLSQPFKVLLPGLGYVGVSAGDPVTPSIDALPEFNTVDLVDWPEQKLYDLEVSARLIEQLQLRRAGRIAADQPLGLLTHHLVLDEHGWEFLRALLRLFVSHSAVGLMPAGRLFEKPSATLGGGRRESGGNVTMVLTSCGRPDLLERTLDSFLRYNTASVSEVVVIEDGDSSDIQPLMKKYESESFRWLTTDVRIGQIAAIDIAYATVNTEFIFHCEDDWEFTAPGFIEKSLKVLRHNDSILQVWIRALDDTNTHPILDYLLMAEEVPYRLLKWDHDGGDTRIWHGFSFNPGLRRRRDYRLLGSFALLDPTRSKRGYEVEMAAAEFFRQRGFFAAILADEKGKGYVRHIGDGRHVLEPVDNSGSSYVRHIGGGRQVRRDYLVNGPASCRCVGGSGEGSHVVDDLIFDIGAHRGEDTEYYLGRGFRVVSVECDPEHVAFLRTHFASEIENGRLTLIDRAIAPQLGPVTFYRNKNVSVWGTAEHSWADRNRALGTEIEEITVDGVTPDALFREHGIPFYLKIDIEGRDLLVVSALAQFPAKPPYLSLEAQESSLDELRAEFAALRALGYDKFKLSPQHHVQRQHIPPRSPHGTAIDWVFEKGSSGMFGEDLDGFWMSEAEALAAYQPVLVIYDVERAVRSTLLRGSFSEFLTKFGYECGWYDTHARHQSWTGPVSRSEFAPP